MRIWAKMISGQRIVDSVTLEIPETEIPEDADRWRELLREVSKPMDLATPVLLRKHISDLVRFRRVVFREDDYLEPLKFDRLEVELILDEKDKKR